MSARLPDRIAIDANGFGWRVWDDLEGWSMVPTNPDNSPIPQPVTYYERPASTWVVTVAVSANDDEAALALAKSVADFAETIAETGADDGAHTFIGDPVRVTP